MANLLPPLGPLAHGHGHGHGLLTTNLAQIQPATAEDPPQSTTTPRPPPPSALDTMRAYRACLNCRGRKSKCDLDPNGGRPPCRRCQRENRDCILGESHRGGRRVRKKPKLEEGTSESPQTPPNQSFPSSAATSPRYTLPGPQPPQPPQPPPPPPPPTQFQNPYDSRSAPGYSWQNQPPTTAGSDTTNTSRHTEQTNITTPGHNQPYRARNESIISVSGKPGHEGIASADLQNPSDALEILARVADGADDENSPGVEQIPGQSKFSRPPPTRPSPPKVDDCWHYRPIQDGMISPEMIYSLFSTYEEFFHPFFPIVPRETFDRTRLPWLSRNEPHLFSAVLTVASRDNERVHQVCYDYMQQLISMIHAGADADVEAVEALLILSQWVSHRPQASVAVGRGEEDRVAWMYIGTALRLGYFLGIDRTAFKSDSHEDPALYNRKRLVWSACYICDRQVSVRVGRGFWARGPGPLSGLKSSDFPTLQKTSPRDEDYSAIHQANLELTQIFSNVHDILYSSKGRGWKEMLEGRYAKYLDDFRASIRNWDDIWGNLICSSRLKASLLLTYDYLRLYVNAFAYQATISRAVSFQRDSQHNPNRPMPLINATAPDARFIYEALDAAKSLLSTFNNLVDPQTLRYMPSSYYLFIIYSAVFLYKARSTTTMTEDERLGVRHMINQTIERLQRASVGANHMGSRYARLLQLLWRKPPSKRSARRQSVTNPAQQQHDNQNLDPALVAGEKARQPDFDRSAQQYDPNNPYANQNQNQAAQMYGMQGMQGIQGLQGMQGMQGNGNDNIGVGGFSWLDLGATWNFATQNGGQSSTGNSDVDGLSVEGMGIEGMEGLDAGQFGMPGVIMPDYRLLEGDNPGLIF